MTVPTSARPILIAMLLTVVSGCATTPAPTLQRKAPVQPQAAGEVGPGGIATQPLPPADTDDGTLRPQIRRGTGQTINRAAASSPPPSIGGTSGEASFNFEGESLQAVAKAILGDMLGQNYVIAPGVQGTVTLATPKPVSPANALSLLEMVLGWNNARMIYADGRYNIVPADQALATGTVPTRTGPTDGVRGFESRVVPLKYVSAVEMEKVLKPYARPNSIVSVDSGRNVITIAGTRSELDNYLRTISIFDVDWMSSMSVGVYPLRTGKATKVVGDLEKVFGESSKSPVAGMFRFLPLEGANAVLAITSQPDYLDDIQEWIERIDGAGAGEQLFTYELKYITAKDLAQNLAQVYGGKSSGSGGGDDAGGGASLIPGAKEGSIDGSGSSFESSQLGGTASGGLDGGSGGDGGGSAGGLGSGSLSLGAKQGGNATVSLEVNGDKVGVAAVEETNSLIVRATGTAWKSIQNVIEKLDVMPMQVHIEAQVAQVELNGSLQYGVSWYFDNVLQRTTTGGGRVATSVPVGLPDFVGLRRLDSGGLSYTFPGSPVTFLSALDQVSDVKMLSTPSVFVRNNSEATFNVGTRIPIQSTSFNSGIGSSGTISNVQYIDTGTILKVRPRVTKDGLVFLDVVQEISSADPIAPNCNPSTTNCNPRIGTRRLKTTAAVASGTTMMMAGLIEDGTTRGSNGLPGLSRLPIIGGLFGQQMSNTKRSETIILLTPTIVRDPKEASDLTDEYSRRFRAMEPLQPVKRK